MMKQKKSPTSAGTQLKRKPKCTSIGCSGNTRWNKKTNKKPYRGQGK